MTAGALKEIAHLQAHGQPLHPFQRLRREYVDYKRQPPWQHIQHLKDFIKIAPHLVPQNNQAALVPTIRHPDLQPNNIFVSADLQITSIIDWQHCAILPLFLQGGIPGSLQNHGDPVSESLEVPTLPDDFDDLSEMDQFKHVELLRRRQLHYHYVAGTAASGSIHAQVLTDSLNILRRKLFRHASDPWEGDNVTLKADLIELTKAWSKMSMSSSSGPATCPIEFTKDVETECSRLAASMEGADSQYQTCLDLVGVGPEGWVPLEQYDDAKRRADELRTDTIDGADSEAERKDCIDHWIFDDFDQDEYL